MFFSALAKRTYGATKRKLPKSREINTVSDSEAE